MAMIIHFNTVPCYVFVLSTMGNLVTAFILLCCLVISFFNVEFILYALLCLNSGYGCYPFLR